MSAMLPASTEGLVDHHCHGLISDDLSIEEFARLATESDWLGEDSRGWFETPFAAAIRTICAPILGLPRGVSIEDYLARRTEIGAPEVNRRLLVSAGIERFVIETGFRASPVASPAAMEEISGRPAHEVVRLEAIAEEVAMTTTAAAFAADFDTALDAALERAIGVKSIAAYRFGLDLPESPPTSNEVARAADAWLREIQETGVTRIVDRTLISHLVWQAVARRCAIQVHVGFGDSDVQLDRANPSLLTPFLRATRASGARIALLHCYPYEQHAAALAHVFPHVYFDVSCVSHYAGPSASQIVRRAFEVAPFSKLMFASDAYGLAEHYAVSAATWARGVESVLHTWQADEWLDDDDAARVRERVNRGNAMALYGIEAAA